MQEFIDGELGAGNRSRFLEHVDGCAACRRELSTLQAVARSVREQAVEQPSPSFDGRLMAEIGREGRPRGLASWVAALRLRPAWAVSLAAVAVVALLLVVRPFGPAGTPDLAAQG